MKKPGQSGRSRRPDNHDATGNARGGCRSETAVGQEPTFATGLQPASDSKFEVAASRRESRVATIDFARVRSTPKSRHDSFEALAVQLFRTSFVSPAGAMFVSLRGDGGDGGVEAYYRIPGGAVAGVQAKYFFQLGDAELRQLDDSLATALKNHPSLSDYWVYIPFDLTGRVAAGARGKSQAERFEEWKKKVEAAAKAAGSALSVTLCTAAVIRAQVHAADPHGGMRRYWFDESVLTQTQIQQCLDDAIAFAGPRYTAALDVVTSAHPGLDFFGGIGDFAAWRGPSCPDPLPTSIPPPESRPPEPGPRTASAALLASAHRWRCVETRFCDRPGRSFRCVGNARCRDRRCRGE